MKDMSVEEFHAAVDLARRLSSRQAARRDRAAGDLVAMGPAAVRPVARTIEEFVADHGVTDDDVKRHDGLASSVVMRIGHDAVPVLEDLVTDRGCGIYVRLWAQHMVFEVLGLEGAERRRVCHHPLRWPTPGRGRDAWVCGSCSARFGEHPTNEPAIPRE